MANYLIYSFNKLRQPALSSFTNTVIQRMSLDEQFVALKPYVDALKTEYNTYIDAVALAANGGKDRILIKNERLETMKAQLNLVAQYVDIMSIDKPAVALAAGFEIKKSPTAPVTELTAPTSVNIDYGGVTGTVRLAWHGVDGATNYGIEHLVKGEENWKNGTYASGKEIIMTGFAPGNYVTFRIRSIGRKDMVSGWSSEVGTWVM